MADVRITAVETADSWAPGTTHSVDVKIDNKETVGPVGWGSVVCPSDGFVNDGHMTDVTLRIRSAAGGVVYERTKGECIPVERPSTSFGPNATIHFEASIPSSGNYTIEAELQVRGDNGSDQSDTYPLTVGSGGSETPQDGDTGGAGLFPDVGESVDPSDPLGTLTSNPALAAVAALAVLVLLAPYAEAGAAVAD
jgi:hypothetical protein